MQSSRRKPEVPHRVARWYPKKKDDIIFQRWAEACSERHNDCLSCPFVQDCQDLVDRLINCMDVPPPGHREMLSKRQ